MSSSPNWTEILESISTAVSAISAIALLIVAISFRDEARLARRRPVLALSHDPAIDSTEFRDPNWNYDLYLRVENKPGQDRAQNVGLELISVRPLNDHVQLKMRVPRRAFAIAEAASYEQTAVHVPLNLSRRFLIAAHDPSKSEREVQLCVVPRSPAKRDVLPPGEYELIVALTADNTDTTYWQSKLHFIEPTGKTEEELRESTESRSRLTLSRPIPSLPVS